MTEKTRVMFVDDEPALLRAFARMFDGDHLEVVCASSAAEGLAVLRARRIDVVVSDLDMPGMDGIEFLSIVRSEHPDCIRMMLTAAPSLERAMRAINDGEVHRFFAKPLDPTEFRRTLLAFAERIARLRREGELSSRHARRSAFLQWVDATGGMEPPIRRGDRGEVLLELDRLEFELQPGRDDQLLSLLGSRAH